MIQVLVGDRFAAEIVVDHRCPPHMVYLVNPDGGGASIDLASLRIETFPPQGFAHIRHSFPAEPPPAQDLTRSSDYHGGTGG